MGTMKLYELVNHYHIGTELTCAEAMFLACNEYYHLNLSEETRKMFSVMGLGMQTEQSCCGAFPVHKVSLFPYRTPIAKHFILCHPAQLVPHLHQRKAQQVLSPPLLRVLHLRRAG